MNTNTATRKVIAQIRHACDGTLLNRPVRAFSGVRRSRARALEKARREDRRQRREAKVQFFAAAFLGAAAILFVAAIATATVSDAAGHSSSVSHGLAAIGRFVGGLLSKVA